MKHTMRLAWILGIGLVAATGCEVSVGDCDEDDAGKCIFPDRDRDASWLNGMDAGTDARTPPPPDAATADAAVRTDAAVGADAGLDASSATPDAAAPTTLNAQQFCDAQFAVARAWSSLLDGVTCGCLDQDDRAGSRSFLAAALRFDDATISACLSNIDRLKLNGVTYDGSKAAACATRFAAQFKGPDQFMAPLASCPGGFDIGKLEGRIGHGRQAVAQLPECRAALAGTKAANAACMDSLECSGGLRCRAIPGGGSNACQTARASGESCSRNDDCADGHICSLNNVTTSESVCIPTTMLKLQGGNCAGSSECGEDLVCDPATKKCITAPADLICN